MGGLAQEITTVGVAQDIPFGCVWVDGLSHPGCRILASACTPSRDYCETHISTLDPITASRLMSSHYACVTPQRVMQSKQEAMMKQAADSHDTVEILYAHCLVRFREIPPEGGAEGFVEAIVQNVSAESGRRPSRPNCFRVRAKYLVGCDGPAGPVARETGFKYDGFANVTQSTSFLVKSKSMSEYVLQHLGASNQYQITRDGVGVGLVTHVEPDEGLWNFIGSWFHSPGEWQNKQEKTVREFMGPLDFEIFASKSWYWNFFVARSFRRRRIFICGDAAHSWPPVCGLGGNTGYGCASNLAWKLAAALRGWGGELLLDSYNVERRNTALRTAQCVMSCMPRPRMLLLMSRIYERFRWIPGVTMILSMKWLSSNSGVHSAQHHCTAGVQLGVRQDFSPVCMTESIIPPDDPFTVYTPRVVSGGRLPVALLEQGGSVYQILSKANYTLLAISISSNDLESVGATELHDDFADHNTKSQSLGLRRLSTASALTVPVESARRLIAAFHDCGAPLDVFGLQSGKHALESTNLEGSRLEGYNLLRREAFILVRPDRIVAWHLPQSRASMVITVDMANEIAFTVTGQVSSNAEEKMQLARRALGWLTSRFLYSLRPFGFLFPQALPLENQTKDDAIAHLRQLKMTKTFDPTTKSHTLVNKKGSTESLSDVSLSKTESTTIPEEELETIVDADMGRASKDLQSVHFQSVEQGDVPEPPLLEVGQEIVVRPSVLGGPSNGKPHEFQASSFILMCDSIDKNKCC